MTYARRTDGPPFASRMANRIETVLSTVLEPGRPVALVNFPNHQNPGDNAIWLGTLAVLQRIGVPVRYESNWSAFSEAAMRHAVGDGPLLLNGGGNFGDLYAGQHGLREHVLEHCKDRRIVQLPQSIWFRDDRNRDHVARLCVAHRRFTLMVRERQSYEIAQRWFDVPVLSCPDMAFGLRTLERAAPAPHDVLWLGRDDAERVARTPPPGIPACDWLPVDMADGMPAGTRRILELNRRLNEFARHDPGRAFRRWRALAWTFGPLANAWVARGAGIVSSAKVVITDRLHAHVFALLLGQPHVVLDNSFGKVRSTFDTWTHDSGLATWADTTADALRAATALLGHDESAG